MGLYMEIHKSAKVWATPMLQLILKSDKVSRSFKMIRQIIPQFTSKIWEGSQAESGWVSFRLNHYGRIAQWIRRFLDFKHILNTCRVDALHRFENLEDNTFESWVQHGGGPWFGLKFGIFRVIIIIKYPQRTFLDFFYFAVILFAAEMPDDRAICEIA